MFEKKIIKRRQVIGNDVVIALSISVLLHFIVLLCLQILLYLLFLSVVFCKKFFLHSFTFFCYAILNCCVVFFSLPLDLSIVNDYQFYFPFLIFNLLVLLLVIPRFICHLFDFVCCFNFLFCLVGLQFKYLRNNVTFDCYTHLVGIF